MKRGWSLAKRVSAAGMLAILVFSASACRRNGRGDASAPAREPDAVSGKADDGKVGGLLRGRVLTPAGRAFEVEVVQDPLSRERGLQHRSHLDENEGMLFVFPRPGVNRFWMSECLIPLDIIWLDASRRVIEVEEKLPVCSAQPCPTYGPPAPTQYVLEVGAGVAARSGIRVGATLELLFAQPPAPS